MHKKRKFKSKHKKFTKAYNEDEKLTKAPHSFVFCRGQVSKNVRLLTREMRRIMEPFTASKLAIRKNNILKDFVSIAGPLGVTHFLSFTKTDEGLNMRLARLPKGPTLYFKVHKYCLCKDVTSSLKRPKASEEQYLHSPLLVLNDFQKNVQSSKDTDMINPHKLCSTMLQNMFPSINIQNLNLNHVRRCVLFNYIPENDRIEFRHYNITVKPVGMSRKMKKLVAKVDMPNMGKYNDISDYLMNRGDTSASESEFEDDPNSNVKLPQRMSGRGNLKDHQSAVRLTELGPRMTLELYKIEDGMCEGEILYHSYISKTEEEKKAIKAKRKGKVNLRKKRKAVQEENIKRKKEARAENNKRSLLGIKRKMECEPDDDAKYYEEEVGEALEENVINSKTAVKKMKLSETVSQLKNKGEKNTDKGKKDWGKKTDAKKKIVRKKKTLK